MPSMPEPSHHSIVFASRTLDELWQGLLSDAPLETAAYGLARPVRTPGGAWRLLVYEIIPIASEEYVERSPVSIELPPQIVANAIKRARNEAASLLLIHTHPFDGRIAPSQRDLEGEAQIRPVLHSRVPTIPHVRLIFGTRELHAALLNADGTSLPLDVLSVGRDLKIYRPERDPFQPGETHDRQVRAFGPDGQQVLSRLRVAIVGLGGTGSVVAQQLAHLGVGSILLIDPDRLENSNLNRVVGTRSDDVGLPKVAIAERIIHSIAPSTQVEALIANVCDTDTARQLLDVDFFFCCTDSHGSRAILTQVAYQYLVPGIDLGVVIRAEAGSVSSISGRVQMLAPGLSCLVCDDLLDPKQVRRDLMTSEAREADPYIVGSAVPQPAVISINSTVSSLAVTIFLSAVTGIPVSARHQQIRFEQGVVRAIESTPQPKCPICSQSGSFLRGDSWSTLGRKRL